MRDELDLPCFCLAPAAQAAEVLSTGTVTHWGAQALLHFLW